MSGFVAFACDSLQHPVLKNFNHWGAWVSLVSVARWEPLELANGVVLSGGQVLTTWEALAENLGWNVLSAKRCLHHFERHHFAQVEKLDWRIKITILDRTTFSVGLSEGDGLGMIGRPMGAGKPRPVFGSEREPLSQKLRDQVIERDGLVCAYCGTQIGPFEIDHVVAVANGGRTEASNLAVACVPCNRSKGAKPLHEWRAETCGTD